MTRARSDGGYTVVEMAIAVLVTMTVVAVVGTTLVSGLRTTSFGAGQSSSLDSARLVVNQVARDLQGSTSFGGCSGAGPAGSCIVVTVQPPSEGPDRTVVYRLTGTTLVREVYPDPSQGTLLEDRTMTDDLANVEQGTRLFTCTVPGALAQVTLTMVVQPADGGDETYELNTVVHPRNVYGQNVSC